MGGKFYQIHLLTERIYQELEDGNDTIAEHIRSLDIATPKTVESGDKRKLSHESTALNGSSK